jgi:hypothetical protein
VDLWGPGDPRWLKILGWLAAALSLNVVADKFDKEAVCSMKRALVLNAVFLGAALAIGFLLLAEPSLAADDKCRSDSGIPSDVVAPIDVLQRLAPGRSCPFFMRSNPPRAPCRLQLSKPDQAPRHLLVQTVEG